MVTNCYGVGPLQVHKLATADRFEPSIEVLLLLLVPVPGGSINNYTCITKIFTLQHFPRIVKLLHFLKCALTLSSFNFHAN